jgi:hypothetical protein
MADTSERKAPMRAHTLICEIGADTAEGVAAELTHFAALILQGKLTIGFGGGPTCGAIYSYRVAPEQTHDVYFQQVADYLAARDADHG